LAERSEYRAIRWAAENYLPVEAFQEAFQAGITEIWQLSEYFDLPEADICAALRYWTDSRGIDFSEQEEKTCTLPYKHSKAIWLTVTAAGVSTRTCL
jgi:hypothetical protein